jgi:hypothetical protein
MTGPGGDGSAASGPQVVDPSVSRAKFAQEVEDFRRVESLHRKRGWWLLEADFPTVLVAFVAVQLRPAPVVCGALLDFTNYDLEPPSVRIVDPITREPYLARELPTALLRRQVIAMPGMPAGAQMHGSVALMQAFTPEEVPFLCIPGVREYHAHPAHSGDSWLAHRGQGEGKLHHILNTIYQYGIQPISDYGIGLRVVGFQQGDPPA